MKRLRPPRRDNKIELVELQRVEVVLSSLQEQDEQLLALAVRLARSLVRRAEARGFAYASELRRLLGLWDFFVERNGVHGVRHGNDGSSQLVG